MSKYQDMVYKCPGPYVRPRGTFDTLGVNSREEHDEALANGWFNSLPEAIAGKSAVVEVKDEPPSRKELEQKAKELNIKFNSKTTDKKLGELITKALGA